MLNLGTWKSVGLDRILRFAWANGIRYVDTAKSYGSEPAIGRWLQAMPEVRKQLFLVTKDHPAIAQRDDQADWTNGWRHFKTDYVDLIFIHAVGDHDFATEVEWPKSKEFKRDGRGDPQVGQGQVRRLLDPPQEPRQILQAAADGGFVDVIMLQNNPWIAEEIGQKDQINRALDNCHKAGIGLISMKQVAGNMKIDEIGQAATGPQRKGADPVSGSAACNLDRRTLRVLLRFNAKHRSSTRERRGGPTLQAADHGRAQ